MERLAPIPAGLTAVEAAAVPIDGLTAERGLTDIRHVAAGDEVLITAATGGLGHFAVQIARTLGAVVVATASPRHHEFVHRLGAAVVIDHTQPGWPDQVRKAIDGGARPRCWPVPGPRWTARHRPPRRRDDRDSGACQPPRHRPSALAAIRRGAERQPADPDGALVRRRRPVGRGVRRYYWQDAAAAHRVAERGHTRGKLALIVDDDLAAAAGV